MKHIIIEGGDRLGKSTLINLLCNHFNYDNINIRHFGKPPQKFPEDISPLEFQAKCFVKEGRLLDFTHQLENDQYAYFENIVIWNRSHLGEYVYGQMFREQNPIEIEKFIKNFEEEFLIYNSETYLILLTADSEFFLEQEDGKSFSKNIEEKSRELNLFDDIYNKSLVDKKLRIKVNKNNKEYIPTWHILNLTLEFINKK